uniref:Uncharacterized protein n=1 Tax=Knipowitschia caucasica TaxID=637954 RepID=A0AAV2LQ62_KNICA
MGVGVWGMGGWNREEGVGGGDGVDGRDGYEGWMGLLGGYVMIGWGDGIEREIVIFVGGCYGSMGRYWVVGRGDNKRGWWDWGWCGFGLLGGGGGWVSFWGWMGGGGVWFGWVVGCMVVGGGWCGWGGVGGWVWGVWGVWWVLGGGVGFGGVCVGDGGGV